MDDFELRWILTLAMAKQKPAQPILQYRTFKYISPLSSEHVYSEWKNVPAYVLSDEAFREATR